MGGFARAFLRPAFVFILVAAIVAFLIVGIGQLLLALHPELGEHEVSGFASTVQEFVRPDLLTALGLSLVVLFGGAFLARPQRRAAERSTSRSPSASVPSSPRSHHRRPTKR